MTLIPIMESVVLSTDRRQATVEIIDNDGRRTIFSAYLQADPTSYAEAVDIQALLRGPHNYMIEITVHVTIFNKSTNMLRLPHY